MKRHLTSLRARLAAGVALAVIGALLAIAGGGLLAAFGTDGKLASSPHTLATRASALVSPVTAIKSTAGVATVVGQPTVHVSASPVPGTSTVFVGIGRTPAVDRYLAGVATGQITNVLDNPPSVGATRRGGSPAQPPASQRFWVAEASSAQTANLRWKIRDGSYRLVIMSGSGHSGFATTAAFALTLPDIAIYSIAGLILGLLIAGGGIALLVGTSQPSRVSAEVAPEVSVAVC